MTESTTDNQRAAGSLNQLLNWYLNESHAIDSEQPWFTDHLMPDGLGDYDTLLSSAESADDQTTNLSFSPVTGAELYLSDVWYRKSIDQISEIFNSEDGLTLLGPPVLHGSMADGSYSLGWSDFDISAVVPSSTLADIEKLSRLRNLALEVRQSLNSLVPLQHHGIQFIAESTLIWFNESSLPIAALESGRTLRESPETLTVNPFFDRKSAVRALHARESLFEKAVQTGEMRHHPFNGEFLQAEFKNANNALYQLKYLLDVCTLAPAVTIAATDKPINKGSAIRELAGKLPDRSWQIISAATEVRSQWADQEGLTHKGNQIPVWIQYILGNDYFEQALDLFTSCLEFSRGSEID